MSHCTEIKTEFRNEGVLRMALDALGCELVPQETVHSWYAVQLPWESEPSKQHACDYAIRRVGGQVGHYGLGVKLVNGCYSLFADFWGIAQRSDNPAPLLGKDFADYITDASGAHHGTGKPTALMQEYALLTGEVGAKHRGLTCRREKNSNGDITLKMSGGNLGMGAEIHLTAKADGSTVVSAHNVSGSGCVDATRWLEDTLGGITSKEFTAEFFHQGPVNAAVHVR